MGGYHGAFGYMCGGEVLPGPTAVPRTHQLQPDAVAAAPDPAGAQPIAWQVNYPHKLQHSWSPGVTQKARSPTVT